jgi:hypothetical protein
MSASASRWPQAESTRRAAASLDGLDLLDLLIATKLLVRAERESIKDTLRRLPRFTAASAKLAAATKILFAATETGNAVSIEEIWADIERVVSRSEIAAALAAVIELAPPTDEDADEVWRVELVKRYATVEGGQTVRKAVRGLAELLGPKKVKADEEVYQPGVENAGHPSMSHQRYLTRSSLFPKPL